MATSKFITAGSIAALCNKSDPSPSELRDLAREILKITVANIDDEAVFSAHFTDGTKAVVHTGNPHWDLFLWMIPVSPGEGIQQFFSGNDPLDSDDDLNVACTLRIGHWETVNDPERPYWKSAMQEGE